MPIDWDAVVLAPVMAVFGDVVRYHFADRLDEAGIALPDAVFDEAYEAVVMDGDQPVSTVLPVLGVRAAHFAAYPGEPSQDGQVVVPNFGTYVVRDTQPDGHGHILLILNLVAPA